MIKKKDSIGFSDLTCKLITLTTTKKNIGDKFWGELSCIIIKVLKCGFEYACGEILHNAYAACGRICGYICGSTYVVYIFKNECITYI
jgi:hypothetical protein